MALFDNSNIKLDVLKKRAFNYRWAEVPDGVIPLTAADPDYPVAPEIQEAMMDYVDIFPIRLSLDTRNLKTAFPKH